MGTKFRCLLSSLLLTALSFSVAHAQPGQWSEPVNISNTVGRSNYPAMAVGADRKIHVVWSDDSRIPGNNPYMTDILYACYDGENWSEPVMLSGLDTTYSASPRIAVDSYGYPHVVWQHNSIFYNCDVYYTSLTDSGWMEPLNLTPNTTSAYQPDIVIDSQDRIHVVWPDFYFGNSLDIIYKYCEDGIWSDLVNISNDHINSGRPRIVSDSEAHLHVVWMQYASADSSCEIFYSYYNGEYWTPRQDISLQPDPAFTSKDPSLALDSNNYPHIVWYQWLGWPVSEIYYSYFNGIDWSIPENISNMELRCDYPRLAINENNEKFLIYYLEDQNDDFSVNFSYCENTIWSSPEILIPLYNSMLSDICIDSYGILHCVISVIYISLHSDIFYMRNESLNAVKIIQETNLSDVSFRSYPNPFNPVTTIRFGLPEESQVKIIIYDILGREVTILADKHYLPGYHSVNWNAQNFTSGIYFARLTAGEFTKTQKLLLVK